MAAIFILLGTSLAGSLLPVAMHLSGRTRGVATAIKLGTFFGGLARGGETGWAAGAWRRHCERSPPSRGCALPIPCPGIGTILATAFIHMLAPAAESLGNPCLPLFWSALYDAWAFLFATAAIALMHLVDYALKVRGLWRDGA